MYRSCYDLLMCLVLRLSSLLLLYVFFFHAPAPTEIYTLSLHDALPISWAEGTLAIFRRARLPYFPDRLLSFNTADRKSTRLNSSHVSISYAVFCLKKKNDISSFVIAPLLLFLPPALSYTVFPIVYLSF